MHEERGRASDESVSEHGSPFVWSFNETPTLLLNIVPTAPKGVPKIDTTGSHAVAELGRTLEVQAPNLECLRLAGCIHGMLTPDKFCIGSPAAQTSSLFFSINCLQMGVGQN